ncbi:ABC-three component system protein [Xanthomonas campestris]|uniref:ABC-three component system protein n=1 Tax=Xanthomonas campestris TaxID=339 RepID=UPI001C6E441B|nr:ABC-three component system protein [Xanthomonas campestris]
MEYLDDVAQHDGAEVTLGQSKSALTANPVSNRAKSLWKTLFNWVTLAKDGGCDPAVTTFEMYISRKVSGSIVDAFSAANSIDAARDAISMARTLLWGSAPEYSLRGAVGADISNYLEYIFGTDDVIVAGVIKNFRLTCGSGSPQADVEAILKTHPISPSKIRGIADHISGFVKRRVDELLEAKKPAILERDEFHTMYLSYTRAIDRDMVLNSCAGRPTREQVVHHLPRVFVGQLQLIGLCYEDQLEAVSDYLMSTADRAEWAASGEVDESSFLNLNENLMRSWANKRRACRVAHGHKSAEEQGEALYADCMQLITAVQGMTAPSHFIPGCLHDMADHLHIGWHPNYKSKLVSKEKL